MTAPQLPAPTTGPEMFLAAIHAQQQQIVDALGVIADRLPQRPPPVSNPGAGQVELVEPLAVSAHAEPAADPVPDPVLPFDEPAPRKAGRARTRQGRPV